MDEKTLFLEKSEQIFVNEKDCFVFEKIATNETINKFTYKDLKENINIFCNFSLKITYVCFGFLQFAVIWNYFLKVCRTDNIFTFLASLILGFFPFVGTLLGAYSVHICWKWDLFHSVLVFISPYMLIHGPMLMIILFETYKDIKRWHSRKVLN